MLTLFLSPFFLHSVVTSLVLGRMQHTKHHDSTLPYRRSVKYMFWKNRFRWSNSVLKCFPKLLYLQNQKTKKASLNYGQFVSNEQRSILVVH